MTKPAKLYLETSGCPKNQADSRQIRGMLAEAGYAFAEEPQDAAVIILNTCGFVDDAKEESIQAILRLSQWKQEGACCRLVVIGCLVQKYGAELAEAIPEADMFLGVANWEDLLAYITSQMQELPGGARLTQTETSQAQTDAAPTHAESESGQALRLIAHAPTGRQDVDLYRPEWAAQSGEEPAGYVKIAEGCSHHCTFCVIPQIRGPYRSRALDAIVDEVRVRVAQGLKEAILVAQDTGAYGRDLAPASSLAELLGALAAIDGLAWIRIMYCYPEEVDEALIEAMRHPKVCPYLDMPIQHIDDQVLKGMGRPLSSARLQATIAMLRKGIPHIAIRTTLMVGFPGETEAAFDSLMAFLDEYPLERVGFFAFSPQPDTPAERLPGQIPQDVKDKRLALATAKRDALLAQWQDAMVGKVVSVMIDEAAGSENAGYYDYEGRTAWDAPEIDGLVSFSDTTLYAPGQIVHLRITHSRDYILSGEITHEPSQ